MSTDYQAENISAFLDGEMSEEQARAFLAAIEQQPEAAAELRRMLKLRELIADACNVEPAATRVPPAAQARWQQAIRAEAAARPAAAATTTVIRPRPALWRAAAPIAATLLIAAGVLWFFRPAAQPLNGSSAGLPPVDAVALNDRPTSPAAPTAPTDEANRRAPTSPPPPGAAALEAEGNNALSSAHTLADTSDAAKTAGAPATGADTRLPATATANGLTGPGAPPMAAAPGGTRRPPPVASLPTPAGSPAAAMAAPAEADSAPSPAPAPQPLPPVQTLADAGDDAPAGVAGPRMAMDLQPAPPTPNAAPRPKTPRPVTAEDGALTADAVATQPEALGADGHAAAGAMPMPTPATPSTAPQAGSPPAPLTASHEPELHHEILHIPYNAQNVVLIRRWLEARGGSLQILTGKDGQPLQGPAFLGLVSAVPAELPAVPALQVSVPATETAALRRYISGLKPLQTPEYVGNPATDPAAAAAASEPAAVPPPAAKPADAMMEHHE